MVVIPMKRAGEPSPRRFVRSGVIDWFWQGGEGVEGGAWIVFLLLIAAAIGAALGTIVVAVLPPEDVSMVRSSGSAASLAERLFPEVVVARLNA